MAHARATRAARRSTIRASEARALQHYVSLVSRLPFVEQVLAEPGYEGVGVWTVIDSEAFADDPRDQVYDAELQVGLALPDALVSYRLVNRLEYGDEKLTQVLPDSAHVAWRRSPQS